MTRISNFSPYTQIRAEYSLFFILESHSALVSDMNSRSQTPEGPPVDLPSGRSVTPKDKLDEPKPKLKMNIVVEGSGSSPAINAISTTEEEAPKNSCFVGLCCSRGPLRHLRNFYNFLLKRPRSAYLID